jgi:hypothetical protein
MEDLWPDFEKMPSEKTPIAIIKEHASKLQDKTNNMISADIEKDDVLNKIYYYANDILKGTVKPDFQYTFYLIAQALNYRYKLFSLGHDVLLYPIYFYDFDKDIKNEVLPGKKATSIVINNQTDLFEMLKKIFSAKKTIKVIQALLAQVS